MPPDPTVRFRPSASGTFNTNDGTFQGNPVPGWDGTNYQLLLGTFEVPSDVTIDVTGDYPLSVIAQGDVKVDGTVAFNGAAPDTSAPGTDGGDIRLISFGAIAGTGTISARGGDGSDSQDGGDGGDVVLQASGDIDIGTVNVDGGSASGGGGVGGGHGGQISVVAGGDFDAGILSGRRRQRRRWR